jgi:hypothetical protein
MKEIKDLDESIEKLINGSIKYLEINLNDFINEIYMILNKKVEYQKFLIEERAETI